MFARRVIVIIVWALMNSSAWSEGNYSEGGWPTLHQDGANRRSVDTVILPKQYSSWNALTGSTVLTAPTTSPDGKQLYVTTGSSRGNSNLHAYNLDGELLWRSPPWISAEEGVDPCAILSSPIVDSAGDIYISDCNQVFAFSPQGSIKWVTLLPPTQPGDWLAAGDYPVNAFTTAVFTKSGDLFGVTNFGDVLVIDRSTGQVLNAPYRLPGLVPPYFDDQPMPDSLLAGGLIEPMIREWVWQLLFGGSMRSANTPAVSVDGDIFVVGSSAKPGLGALYQLVLEQLPTTVNVTLGFQTEIGLGSGSSPSLSPAFDQVYVSDEDGWLYAVNTDDGAVLWKQETQAAAAAAAVGKDGTVYALQQNAPAVIAISSKGEVLWQSDFSHLKQQLPSSWIFGAPVAVGNGNPTVSGDSVLVPIIYGYRVPFMGNLTLPVRSVLAAIDLKTGKAIKDVVSLKDDSAGVTGVLADGTLVNSLGAVTTSAVNPLSSLVNFLLPDDLQLLQPLGGIQVSLPIASPNL